MLSFGRFFNRQRIADRAGVKDDDFCRFCAHVRSAMPVIDHFDNRITRLEYQLLTLLRFDREIALQQNTCIDDRMFVHRQARSWRNRNPLDCDFGLSRTVGGEAGAIPTHRRTAERLAGHRFVCNGRADHEGSERWDKNRFHKFVRFLCFGQRARRSHRPHYSESVDRQRGKTSGENQRIKCGMQ